LTCKKKTKVSVNVMFCYDYYFDFVFFF